MLLLCSVFVFKTTHFGNKNTTTSYISHISTRSHKARTLQHAHVIVTLFSHLFPLYTKTTTNTGENTQTQTKT